MDHPQAETAESLKVSVETGPHAGMTRDWSQPGSYLVGRASHSDLALIHDLLTSPEHCRLEHGPQGWTIRDLGSRQGTVVNGSSVTRSQVLNGDVLEIGMSRLRVTIGTALPATAAWVSAPVQRSDRSTTSLTSSLPHASHLLDIPGYTITRKIGQGGMGVVYEAVHGDSGQRVAIKTVIPIAGTAQKSVQLFQREMNLLSQLSHPHIVQFLASGEHAGQIYLVMEYVDCLDLKALVNRLPRERQLAIYCQIACQVLEALQYAHQRKLVHRDIKPGNILVMRSGQQLCAKLADFGLAKNFETAGLSQLTNDHELRGTPMFMPWEQLQQSRYAKPASDLYSVAASLFFFLTGQAPGHRQPVRESWLSRTTAFFQSGRRAEPIMHDVTESELSRLPSALADVLRTGLAAEPTQRFETAAAMREAIQHLLA